MNQIFEGVKITTAVARAARLFITVVAVSLLGGCASSSLFSPYPVQIQSVKQQVQNKQYGVAQGALESYRNDTDKILYMMERGRVSQLAKDRKSSIEDFKIVIAAMEANEEKAKISLSDTASQGGALLTNDNAIPYTGDGYERVFVHHFQALNYLFNNDLTAAQVEVRRANIEQNVALREHEDELAEAEEKGREHAEKNKSFMGSFSAMQAVAGKVKNSFQNAYTFFVSGMIYEILGKPNDAYIDYKKALEIFPDNVYVQKDVLRLAKQLSMKDDYRAYKKRYPIKLSTPAKNEGELIILFERGFAPVKMEVGVPLFIVGVIQKVAFPTYSAQWQPPVTMKVSVAGGVTAGKTIGETSPIVNVQAMAAKALEEKLPAMLVRQILRVIAKEEIADQAGKAGGSLAEFGATVFNILSGNADRRSWLTLPNDAQLLREHLAQGEYQLNLSDGKARGLLKVKIEPGKRTVVRVVATGQTLHTDAIVM